MIVYFFVKSIQENWGLDGHQINYIYLNPLEHLHGSPNSTPIYKLESYRGFKLLARHRIISGPFSEPNTTPVLDPTHNASLVVLSSW
jgi:hypothetical protein